MPVHFELSSKQNVHPGRWNANAQKVTGNSEEARTINAYLKTMEQQVFQEYHELIQKGIEITAANLKNKLLGEGGNQRKEAFAFPDVPCRESSQVVPSRRFLPFFAGSD
ncbi:MAG TPA: hypothetical protein VF974_03925 [Patescibacteria group bacterium]